MRTRAPECIYHSRSPAVPNGACPKGFLHESQFPLSRPRTLPDNSPSKDPFRLPSAVCRLHVWGKHDPPPRGPGPGSYRARLRPPANPVIGPQTKPSPTLTTFWGTPYSICTVRALCDAKLLPQGRHPMQKQASRKLRNVDVCLCRRVSRGTGAI